jgi:hypothetical protein
MKTHAYLVAALLLAGGAGYAADALPGAAPDSLAAFARLKTLVGEWEADTANGKAHLSVELIAGGTALVERESAEKMPAMLTVYTLDHGRLTLTHYCMAGNQPRMQVRSFNAQTGELQFQFVDGGNMKPTDGHMHNVTLRLADTRHLNSEWEFYENGQRKMTETAEYTRVR